MSNSTHHPSHGDPVDPGSKPALVWAGAFVVAGVLGFVPNPILGSNALFAANIPHNVVHLLTGFAFLLIARGWRVAPITFMKTFGTVYVLVGVIGTLVTVDGGSGRLLGVVHINAADNYLHMALGVGILVTGVWMDTLTREAAFRSRILTES